MMASSAASTGGSVRLHSGQSDLSRTGQVSVETSTAGNVASGGIRLATGNAATASGALHIHSGPAVQNTGGITIEAGRHTSSPLTHGHAGLVSVTGGKSLENGGNVTVRSGDGANSGNFNGLAGQGVEGGGSLVMDPGSGLAHGGNTLIKASSISVATSLLIPLPTLGLAPTAFLL